MLGVNGAGLDELGEPFEVARAASTGVAELARLDASRRHPAGEAAARHGTAGRSGEDDETTEPRA
jgi:hypothetical protein